MCCGLAPEVQLFLAMGYLQGSGQDSNIRWKTGLNQDEGAYQSPAWSTPLASRPANSRLSARQQSIYPPPDLPSTAGSHSLPVHGRAALGASTWPEDAKPFDHLRPSMGRLSPQNSEEMVGKTPPGVLRNSTKEEHLDGNSMAPPEAVLTSLVCAAVTRLSMFSGPRATDNRILNPLLSALFF